MGMFSKSKNSDELILVFNIGSSFVGGALFWARKSGVPQIIFSAREPIPVEDKVEIDRFLVLTMKALDGVANQIFKAGLGAPKRAFCVLSSPWLVSQTRVISLKKNAPFAFTNKLADELIQKEIKIFQEENAAKYSGASGGVRAVELKNIKTSLNGYETADPINQKASELEMTVFISMGAEEILKQFENTIRKHFNVANIKFSSSVLATFAVVRDLYPAQENFLLVYIGGEVTDISMTKKNILRESISFPLGCNFLTRGVAESFGCTLVEANSLMSLLKDGHAEESVEKKMKSIMEKLRAEWIKEFQQALANLTNDVSIPSAIYIDMGKDLADFFSETIRNEQFSQYTLTESKFDIKFLNTEVFTGVVEFEKSAVREPFLIIDALYINRTIFNS